MSAKLGPLMLTLLLLAGGGVRADAAVTPQAVVERLHQTLLGAMTGADKLGYGGRFDLIAPVLVESFDFEVISRIVTGRYWQDLNADQRSRFQATFTTLSTATYASNFSSFAGEQFVTVGQADARNGVVVRTELVKADGGRVPLTYMLHKSNTGDWRIVNVVAQGVSDLSLKRVEYAAVIKEEGFDSLLERLDEKIGQMGHTN